MVSALSIEFAIYYIFNMCCKLHHDIINQFILLKLHCLTQTPMFVGLTTKPKHTQYVSTDSFGNLVCKTQIDNTLMSSPIAM